MQSCLQYKVEYADTHNKRSRKWPPRSRWYILNLRYILLGNTVCLLKWHSFMVILHIVIAPAFNLQLVTFLKPFTFSLGDFYLTYDHMKFLKQKMYMPCFLSGNSVPKSRWRLQFPSYPSDLCATWNLPRQQISASCGVLYW